MIMTVLNFLHEMVLVVQDDSSFEEVVVVGALYFDPGVDVDGVCNSTLST